MPSFEQFVVSTVFDGSALVEEPKGKEKARPSDGGKAPKKPKGSAGKGNDVASTPGEVVSAAASTTAKNDEDTFELTEEQTKSMEECQKANDEAAVVIDKDRNYDPFTSFNGILASTPKVLELLQLVERNKTQKHLKAWGCKILDLQIQINSLYLQSNALHENKLMDENAMKSVFENLYKHDEIEVCKGGYKKVDKETFPMTEQELEKLTPFNFNAHYFCDNGNEIDVAEDELIEKRNYAQMVWLRTEMKEMDEWKNICRQRLRYGSLFVTCPNTYYLDKTTIRQVGIELEMQRNAYQLAFAIVSAWSIETSTQTIEQFLHLVQMEINKAVREKIVKDAEEDGEDEEDEYISSSRILQALASAHFSTACAKLSFSVKLPNKLREKKNAKAMERKRVSVNGAASASVDGAGSKRKRASVDGAGSKRKRVSIDGDGSKKKRKVPKGDSAKPKKTRKTATDKDKSRRTLVTMHVKKNNPQNESESKESYEQRIDKLVTSRIAELDAEKKEFQEANPKDESESFEAYEARINEMFNKNKRSQYAKSRRPNVDKVVDPKNAELAARFQEGRDKKQKRINELMNEGMSGEDAAKQYEAELKVETNKRRNEAAKRQRDNEKACISFIRSNLSLAIEKVFENNNEDTKIALMQEAYAELCDTATAMKGRYKLLCYMGVYKTFRGLDLEESDSFLRTSLEVPITGNVLSNERATLLKVCDLIKAFIRDFTEERLKDGDFVLKNCETREDGVYADASTNIYKILVPFINLWKLGEDSSLGKVYFGKGYKQDNVTHILSVLSLLLLYKMIQEALELSKDGTKDEEIMSLDPSKQDSKFKNHQVLKRSEHGAIFGIIKRSYLLHWYDSQEFSGLQDLRVLPEPAKDVELDV